MLLRKCGLVGHFLQTPSGVCRKWCKRYCLHLLKVFKCINPSFEIILTFFRIRFREGRKLYVDKTQNVADGFACQRIADATVHLYPSVFIVEHKIRQADKVDRIQLEVPIPLPCLVDYRL